LASTAKPMLDDGFGNVTLQASDSCWQRPSPYFPLRLSAIR
jgi:hypothetical protein